MASRLLACLLNAALAAEPALAANLPGKSNLGGTPAATVGSVPEVDSPLSLPPAAADITDLGGGVGTPAAILEQAAGPQSLPQTQVRTGDLAAIAERDLPLLQQAHPSDPAALPPSAPGKDPADPSREAPPAEDLSAILPATAGAADMVDEVRAAPNLGAAQRGAGTFFDAAATSSRPGILRPEAADELPPRDETPSSRAAAQIPADPRTRARLTEYYRKSHDWPDRVESYRESYPMFAEILGNGPAGDLFSAEHPLRPFLLAGLVENPGSSEPRPMSFRSFTDLLGWTDGRPNAAKARELTGTIENLLQSYRAEYAAQAAPPGSGSESAASRIDGLIQRLRAHRVSWKHIRAMEAWMFSMLLDFVSDRVVRSQLKHAKILDPFTLSLLKSSLDPSDEQARTRAEDLFAGMQSMRALTRLLMLRLEPSRMPLREPGRINRFLSSWAALHPGIEKEPMHQAFLDYYRPSHDWLERLEKARGVKLFLDGVIEVSLDENGDQVPVINPLHPAYPYMVAAVQFEPGEPNAFKPGIPEGLVSPNEFGQIMGWGTGTKAAIEGWKRLQRLMYRARSRDADADAELLAWAETLDAHNVKYTQILLWTVAYNGAALKSIPPERERIQRDLADLPAITDSVFARMDLLAGLDPNTGEVNRKQKRVIKNPTAVARTRYTWMGVKVLWRLLRRTRQD